jgi:hypothetical protein
MNQYGQWLKKPSDIWLAFFKNWFSQAAYSVLPSVKNALVKKVFYHARTYLSQSGTYPCTCSGRGAQASTTRTTSTAAAAGSADRSPAAAGQLFSRDSDSHT